MPVNHQGMALKPAMLLVGLVAIASILLVALLQSHTATIGTRTPPTVLGTEVSK